MLLFMPGLGVLMGYENKVIHLYSLYVVRQGFRNKHKQSILPDIHKLRLSFIIIIDDVLVSNKKQERQLGKKAEPEVSAERRKSRRPKKMYQTKSLETNGHVNFS